MYRLRNIIILFVVLFIIVPIAINEAYKIGGYTTLWGANDVLSYYGSVLQALASIIVLRETILYTRNQIRYEHLENVKTIQIQKVKEEIYEYVECLYPLRLYRVLLSFEKNSDERITAITDYQIELKIKRNKIHNSLLSTDLETYISELDSLQNTLIDKADEAYSIISSSQGSEGELSLLTVSLTDLTKNTYVKLLKKQLDVFDKVDKDSENKLSEIIG